MAGSVSLYSGPWLSIIGSGAMKRFVPTFAMDMRLLGIVLVILAVSSGVIGGGLTLMHQKSRQSEKLRSIDDRMGARIHELQEHERNIEGIRKRISMIRFRRVG